jgi:intraflagellar transport protein 172
LAKRYFLPLAAHFAEISDYALAEKYFVLAGKPQDAVSMYSKANLWEQAHTLATSFMSKNDVAVLYISQAKELENKRIIYFSLTKKKCLKRQSVFTWH